MIKFLSKAFGVCVIIASIIFFAAGLVFGYYSVGLLTNEAQATSNTVLLRIVGIIVGGIIGFILDVLIFGSMAQLVDMRRRLIRIEEALVTVCTEKIEVEEVKS